MPSWQAPLVGPGLAVDLARPRDLSLRFELVDEPSSSSSGTARAFGLPAGTTRAVAVGAFVGDVRRGGSCNCETLVITPHGDGTHTEGVGHLLDERLPVVDLIDARGPAALALIPALLVTVAPRALASVADDVAGNHAPDDRVVDELSLVDAIAHAMSRAPATMQGWRALALVIRTARGEDVRRTRFSGTNPAYLTVDAAELVRTRGFHHVLVDLPSLDREDDGGLLGAHHAFFDVPARLRSLTTLAPEAASAVRQRTVTELIAVDSDVVDGLYALSLQLAPLAADAVPSRPLLFPLVSTSASWLRP